MIVKFLKNSKSFAAVSYNENRVKNGEAELLEKKNFGSSMSLFDDNTVIRDYFQLWSARNSRIKNPQLHVVFSTKDNSHTKGELRDIAVQWLKEMGYGDVPYLIYFHKNSNHNHVHIVTTRVDKNGYKINDSFEYERGLRTLNNLMEVDEFLELRKKIASMLRYSFSTRTQLKELLIHSGMRVLVNNDKSSFNIEWGSVKTTLSFNAVDFCAKRYHHDIDKVRRKQIQALIYKYGKIFNRDEFCYFFKHHFGLEFILYGKDDSVNGFTIIDYSNKSIYKGSEVLSLKTLNSLFEGTKNIKVEPVNILLNYLSNNRYSNLSKTENYLNRFGITISDDNLIDMFGKSYVIPDVVLNYWEYMDRLDYISNSYRISNYDELKFLTTYLNIDYTDLKHYKFNDYNPYIDYYISIIDMYGLNSIIQNPELLKQHDINLYSYNNKFYFVDENNHCVVSLDELTVNEDYKINYNLYNQDLVMLPDSNTGGVISASLFNFDSNVGASSNKGKRKKS